METVAAGGVMVTVEAVGIVVTVTAVGVVVTVAAVGVVVTVEAVGVVVTVPAVGVVVIVAAGGMVTVETVGVEVTVGVVAEVVLAEDVLLLEDGVLDDLGGSRVKIAFRLKGCTPHFLKPAMVSALASMQQKTPKLIKPRKQAANTPYYENMKCIM